MALVIRNLTPDPIDLKLWERFKATGLNKSFFSVANFTSNFTAQAAPVLPESEENAQSFDHRDVSITIPALASSKTDIIPPRDDTLRLTFEIQDQRHCIDMPISSARSIEMTPLTDEPKMRYTAIYLPNEHLLVLFSSSNLNCWMKKLRDETPLSALSIPGTHNSPTYHRALPSVRCQAVSPREQLNNGVRFFDVRLQVDYPNDPSKETLSLVHSVFPISLTGSKSFRELIDEVHDFLENNPSETVVLSLKREGVGKATDSQLGRILRDHYAGDVRKWHTEPRIPTLGESRNKVVVIRRFGLDEHLAKEWSGRGWCINAETWADNTPHATSPSGDICVQDFYEVLETENIDRKIQYSIEQCERASECVCALPGLDTKTSDNRKESFYINFLSASNFWKVGCWPERIAAKLNPAMVQYLCKVHGTPEAGKPVGDGSTGIVVCDWVGNNGDWDLVRCIVSMNSRLEVRETLQR